MQGVQNEQEGRIDEAWSSKCCFLKDREENSPFKYVVPGFDWRSFRGLWILHSASKGRFSEMTWLNISAVKEEWPETLDLFQISLFKFLLVFCYNSGIRLHIASQHVSIHSLLKCYTMQSACLHAYLSEQHVISSPSLDCDICIVTQMVLLVTDCVWARPELCINMLGRCPPTPTSWLCLHSKPAGTRTCVLTKGSYRASSGILSSLEDELGTYSRTSRLSLGLVLLWSIMWNFPSCGKIPDKSVICVPFLLVPTDVFVW